VFSRIGQQHCHDWPCPPRCAASCRRKRPAPVGSNLPAWRGAPIAPRFRFGREVPLPRSSTGTAVPGGLDRSPLSRPNCGQPAASARLSSSSGPARYRPPTWSDRRFSVRRVRKAGCIAAASHRICRRPPGIMRRESGATAGSGIPVFATTATAGVSLRHDAFLLGATHSPSLGTSARVAQFDRPCNGLPWHEGCFWKYGNTKYASYYMNAVINSAGQHRGDHSCPSAPPSTNCCAAAA
jgi:hypothetical protein